MGNDRCDEFIPPFEIRKPRFTLDENLILSERTRNMLSEAISALKYHKIIYTDWGFENVDPEGRNMIINLYGPPGTGKTLAAEAFAGSIGRDIIHISIAEIESKFVGDTAKNISIAFKHASNEGAVLFFDEADTLLGRRLSSVTQGIDNEINAMRSTLLIELERFDGVAIFATNFAKNYDKAFVSRIRYHIEFSLPGFDERVRMWERFLVPGIPLSDSREIIVNSCAEMSDGLSGREIRNTLRTALPKAIVGNIDSPELSKEHLELSINDILRSKKHVGGHITSDIDSVSAVDPARQLLGVNK
ncbi:ATP-binding protein [Plesiomonas shigelloides]